MGDAYYGYDKSLWISAYQAAFAVTNDSFASITIANAAVDAFRAKFTEDN